MDIIYGSWESTSSPTQTDRESYEVAVRGFKPVLEKLTKLVEEDLAALESDLESARGPWTPGRIPTWR
jgi:hypothetical protein